MIFPAYPCIFFHIMRTAGTSVEKWLCGPDRPFPPADSREVLFGLDRELGRYLQHAPPHIVRDLVGDAMFQRCYRFTVVRNPFARVVSLYFYTMGTAAALFSTFDDFIAALPALARTGDNGGFVLPQVCYTRLDGAACCDAIVRFEALPDSLRPVADRLRITRPLPFVNPLRDPRRGARAVSSFYTARTAGIVVDAYGEDFAAFGYPTDPTAANNSATVHHGAAR